MMQYRKHDFSLLELIICLGILAVLASILLENFADVKARECEKITQERGRHIRSMINGSSAEEGFGAFLSDMGRFPSVYIPAEGDGNGSRRLAELYDPSIWYCSGSATALQRQRSVSASEILNILRSPGGSTFPAEGSGIYLALPQIQMNVGWNGPYINMANPVRGKLYDGWGNPWHIISNYNLRVNGNHLEEDHTTANKIVIYSSESQINSLRDTSNNRRTRIDGIASFGANNADDSAQSDIAPADADQKFLFPHNMDNHGQENLARLTVTLKLRESAGPQWRTLPPIAFWKADSSYSKGEIAVANNSLYCCITTHTSGTSFSESNWYRITAAVNYDPTTHGSSSFTGLCIYENSYYLRNTANMENSFTASNWLRIADVDTLPDSISLLIFTPVMQGSYEERVMQLGYYHFFRNTSSENAHGVKPLYGTAGTADIDCTGDTTTVYSASDDYNGRYLIAEDHSSSFWNEFVIKRLIPGRRKIFCILYSSHAKICYQSPVEVLTLKKGSNFITLYLERKL